MRWLYRTRGARRSVGAAVVALGLAAGLAIADTKPDVRNLAVEPIAINASPIGQFDRAATGRTRFGRLEWRGGLVLTSTSKSFGGWSGLVLDGDGRKLAAVSDAGTWLTGEITYENGRPAGIKAARLGPLLARKARTLKRSRDRDAEAIALLDGSPDHGTVLIAFERNHRIGRFRIDRGEVRAPLGFLRLPFGAGRMQSNNGFEAVTSVRSGPLRGTIIAISERLLDKAGHHTGWLWINGEPKSFGITNPGDYEITDMASLPSGGVLVLERRFRWSEGVKMRIRQLDPGDLHPGAVLAGEVLIEADLTQEIDNMEGMAIHRGPQGETVVTLISDDNFNTLLQRTVLLQFTLLPKAEARRELGR